MVFSFGSFLFSSRALKRSAPPYALLSEEIVVAILAQVTAKALVGIIKRDLCAATFAGDKLVFPAVRADVVLPRFVVMGFGFRQFFAADFTNYCFHILEFIVY